MKAVRIETARCELPYASSSRPHAANSSDIAPLLSQPFEPVVKAGGCRRRALREDAATLKWSSTTRWRAADCTNLIGIVDLSFVGLYELICEAAEQLEAADGRCCSVCVDGRSSSHVRFGTA